MLKRKPTGTLSVRDAVQEDAVEPLKRVLVHGVNVAEISDTEEENLSVDSNRDVLTTCHINVFLCLLGNDHFSLHRHDNLLNN